MKVNRMVVAMDLSDAAIKAAKWASERFAPNAEMILAHVIEPPDLPHFARHVLPPSEVVESAAREYATTRLHEIATYLTPGSTRSEIRVGKPHEQITRLVRELNADLVVIGPHSDRPRPSKFLGTTADRIVRTSPVPVLVAINPPAGQPRNLLVPVDDLSITPTLLEWTHDLSDTFDADVTLLHVWSNAIYSHVASMSYATAKSETDARREINKELQEAGVHWLEEVARTGLERQRVTAAVTYGNPGDATVEMAASMHADLIVLGRRGSGRVAPALLGSTVGTVLHGASCPVLVVTEPHETSA